MRKNCLKNVKNTHEKWSIHKIVKSHPFWGHFHIFRGVYTLDFPAEIPPRGGLSVEGLSPTCLWPTQSGVTLPSSRPGWPRGTTRCWPCSTTGSASRSPQVPIGHPCLEPDRCHLSHGGLHRQALHVSVAGTQTQGPQQHGCVSFEGNEMNHALLT